RIVAVRSIVVSSVSQQTVQFGTQLDILQNEMRAIVAPKQAADAVKAFNFTKGMADSYAEQEVLNSSFDPDSGQAVGALDIIQQAEALPGVSMVLIGPDNLSQLAALNLSADVKARITAAVQNGAVVTVPNSMVTIDGQQRSAWFQTDTATF